MQKDVEGIGEKFQEETKYYRDKMPLGFLDWSKKPDTYKQYHKGIETIKLPEPLTPETHELWFLIARRRSRRDFISKPLTLDQVSQLLWATQGITLRLGITEFRVTPSAGGLYPIETYLVVNRVENLPPGVYHYNVKDMALEKLKAGKNFSLALAVAALNQDLIVQGALSFIWTAFIPRVKWKYRQRCFRYIYLDAGHIGENLYLAAEALGFGCCTIGAFYDEEVNQIIGVDGKDETAVYLGVVGQITKS